MDYVICYVINSIYSDYVCVLYLLLWPTLEGALEFRYVNPRAFMLVPRIMIDGFSTCNRSWTSRDKAQVMKNHKLALIVKKKLIRSVIHPYQKLIVLTAIQKDNPWSNAWIASGCFVALGGSIVKVWRSWSPEAGLGDMGMWYKEGNKHVLISINTPRHKPATSQPVGNCEQTSVC